MRTTAAAFALLGAAHAATEPAVQLGLPYDVDLAQTGVLYASAAYCPPANVEAWSFKSSKCNALPATLYASHVAPKTGAFALVAIDSGLSAVVVAFKGTNGTAQDFEHDLAGGEFSFSPCTVAGTDLPGNAHSGFCSYYNSLVDDGLGDSIAAAVAAHPSHDLVFTGHSLGGAAAALAASDAHYRLKVSPARTLLYTFGEPRTGTKGFAQGVEAAVDGAYRVVHSADWIAHMPPCCSLMIGGLSTCQDWSDCPYHHANEVWYPGDMADPSAYQNCDGGEDTHCEHTINMSIDDHLHYFDMEVGDECCFPDTAAAAAPRVRAGLYNENQQ